MFRIKLPLAVTGRPAAGAPHSELVRGNGRILVVDDEPAVRESAVALLRSLGYEPSAAPDGDAAVARLREDPSGYDLVVLDLRMPGDGVEATFDRLRQLAPGLRVILWSGYGGDADVEGILRRGALAFVQKPYQVDEFSRVVRAALER